MDKTIDILMLLSALLAIIQSENTIKKRGLAYVSVAYQR
jgi:hypothetical protein